MPRLEALKMQRKAGSEARPPLHTEMIEMQNPTTDESKGICYPRVNHQDICSSTREA